MESNRDELLPGSLSCIGCGGLTFRQREDALCPRCAFEAESLIERIELDGLHRDLQLMTEFDAYYQQREVHRKRFKKLAGPVFARRPVLDPISREPTDFTPDPFWTALRKAS
ncbi:MAG: hypothetical protein ABI200_07630 [Gaiellales bacterium]